MCIANTLEPASNVERVENSIIGPVQQLRGVRDADPPPGRGGAAGLRRGVTAQAVELQSAGTEQHQTPCCAIG